MSEWVVVMGRKEKGKRDGRENVPRARDQNLWSCLLGLPASGVETSSRQAY